MRISATHTLYTDIADNGPDRRPGCRLFKQHSVQGYNIPTYLGRYQGI